MSSPEEEEPRNGIRHHHLLMRPAAEFPVMRSDSFSDDEEDDNSEEGSLDVPENTRNSSWSISKSWLQEVLSSHLCQTDEQKAAFRVNQFSVRSGSEPSGPCERHPQETGLVIGDSALSEVLSVNVQYQVSCDQQSAPTIELVVKLPPRDPVSRFFVTEAQFDLREIKFYTQVVPDLMGVSEGGTLPIPSCLHASYRTSPHHSVLVLENLKASGYRGANFAEGLTLAQTKAAITSLARVHAPSLILKIRDGVNLPERYPFLFRTSAATDSYQQLVERGLPQLARFLQRRGALPPTIEGASASHLEVFFSSLGNAAVPGEFGQILQALTSLRAKTRGVIASLLAPREPLSLITHTDFWCSNLLFRGEEPRDLECCILDWQMITYSHPANDLALLIVSSLDAELRRNHTAQLLDFYLERLAEQCAPSGIVLRDLNYTGDMLRQDFKRSQLLALLLCIGSVDVALGHASTEERLLHVLKDLYGEGILTDLEID